MNVPVDNISLKARSTPLPRTDTHHMKTGPIDALYKADGDQKMVT
jgi:hypothetical protein